MKKIESSAQRVQFSELAQIIESPPAKIALLIEEDPLLRRIMGIRIKKMGYTVLSLSHAETIQDVTRQYGPAFIFSNYDSEDTYHNRVRMCQNIRTLNPHVRLMLYIKYTERFFDPQLHHPFMCLDSVVSEGDFTDFLELFPPTYRRRNATV